MSRISAAKLSWPKLLGLCCAFRVFLVAESCKDSHLVNAELTIGVTLAGQGELVVKADDAELVLPFDGSAGACPMGTECTCEGPDCEIVVANPDHSKEMIVRISAQPAMGFEGALSCDSCEKQPDGEYWCTLDQTNYSIACTAVFGALATLEIEPPVNALISSGEVLNEIECRDNDDPCRAEYVAGSTVRLEALADRGYTLVEWTGDCAGIPFSRMDRMTTISVPITKDTVCGVRMQMADPLLITPAAMPRLVPAGGGRVNLDAAVTGGVPPYTFAWDGSDTDLVHPDVTSAAASATVVQNVTFTVTVTDAAGIRASAQVSVIVDVAPPAVDVRVCEEPVGCQVDTTIQPNTFRPIYVYPQNPLDPQDGRSPAAVLGVVRYQWTIKDGMGSVVATMVFSDTEMGATGPVVDGERFIFCGRMVNDCGMSEARYEFEAADLFEVQLEASIADGGKDVETLYLNVQ